MRLGDRDDEERPAVFLQRSSDHRLPVPQPRPMNHRTPAPTTIAAVTVDDPSAARAELAVVGQRRRPNPGDDLFRSPEGSPLLIRIRRDNPPLTSTAPRPVEREEAKLSLGFRPGAHGRPAVSSAAQRSAAGQREARRPAAPPIRVLMAGHQHPRTTRVRIPYAPPFASGWNPRPPGEVSQRLHRVL